MEGSQERERVSMQGGKKEMNRKEAFKLSKDCQRFGWQPEVQE